MLACGHRWNVFRHFPQSFQEVVETAAALCVEITRTYPRAVFFAGELVFEEPKWYHRILHNETAYAILRRIRFAGLPMVILPIRIASSTA